MNKILKKVASLASICIVSSFVVGVDSNYSHASTISSEECYPAVLMLRGSGEKQISEDKRSYKVKDEATNIEYMQTNGYEGDKNHEILKAFVNQTNPSQTVSKTRFIGIDYEALHVQPDIPEYNYNSTPTYNLANKSVALTKHMVAYSNSYNDGAQKIADFIKSDEMRGCDTQYMLVGYSQGAISIRLAMNLLNETSPKSAKKIMSSYVIGDPFQKANGASSERQRSIANTAYDRTGLYRGSLDFAINFKDELPELVGESLPDTIENFSESFTKADNLIYRDEGDNSIVSRSLCHIKDPVCAFDIHDLDIEEHNNYFTPKTSGDPNDGDYVNFPGDIDLRYEISEFDKQVQKLADSTSHNPRKRVLTTTTTPIVGHDTVYNVANALVTDSCRWDFENDGIFDLEQEVCQTINYTHESEDAQMSVTVTDSFGINHKLTMKAEALDTDFIESPTELSSKKLYQFKSKKDGRCLAWNQLPGSNTVVENVTNSALTTNLCYNGLHGFDVFKSSTYSTSSGKQNRITSIRYSEYAMSAKNPTIAPIRRDIEMKKINSDTKQNIAPKYAKSINGIPYFTINYENSCLSYDNILLHPILQFVPCDIDKDAQLFSVREMQPN